MMHVTFFILDFFPFSIFGRISYGRTGGVMFRSSVVFRYPFESWRFDALLVGYDFSQMQSPGPGNTRDEWTECGMVISGHMMIISGHMMVISGHTMVVFGHISMLYCLGFETCPRRHWKTINTKNNRHSLPYPPIPLPRPFYRTYSRVYGK